MFWDFGSIHMFVTGVRAVSTQNAAGDHVKESSHRVISSRNRSSSSGDEQLHSLACFTEDTSVLTKTIEEKTVRQGSLAVEVEKPKVPTLLGEECSPGR